MSRLNGRGVDAVEAHARAVGRDGEGLGAVAAVDLGGVGAVAALDQVAAVARVPDHAVVAGLAEHLVVAGAAGQHVVAVAAEQEVVAALAEQRVVAGLAEELVGARAAGQRVVAVAAEQSARAARRWLRRARSCRCRPGRRPGSGWCWRPSAVPPDDGHGAAVDEDAAGRVAAERDRVVEVVAESPSARRRAG